MRLCLTFKMLIMSKLQWGLMHNANSRLDSYLKTITGWVLPVFSTSSFYVTLLFLNIFHKPIINVIKIALHIIILGRTIIGMEVKRTRKYMTFKRSYYVRIILVIYLTESEVFFPLAESLFFFFWTPINAFKTFFGSLSFQSTP